MKAKLIDLEKIFEKFVNGRNLDAIHGKQRPKHNRSGLRYQYSTSKG